MEAEAVVELEEIAADYIDQSANIYFLDQQWARLNRRSAAYPSGHSPAPPCARSARSTRPPVNDTADERRALRLDRGPPRRGHRQILQSSGFGALGDYDTLPRECGCALPNSALDTGSFDDLIAGRRR